MARDFFVFSAIFSRDHGNEPEFPVLTAGMNGKRGMGVGTPTKTFSLEEPRSPLRGSSLCILKTYGCETPKIHRVANLPWQGVVRS